MSIFGKWSQSKDPGPECEIHVDDRSLVRAEDIEWWNRLSLDDCKELEQQDNVTKVAMLTKLMEEDGSAKST
jgi:hypothetical protein